MPCKGTFKKSRKCHMKIIIFKFKIPLCVGKGRWGSQCNIMYNGRLVPMFPRVSPNLNVVACTVVTQGCIPKFKEASGSSPSRE